MEVQGKVVDNISRGGIKIKIVTELPQTGKSNVVYFVPIVGEEEAKNLYEEYVWVDGKWELLGSATIDLSDYATKNYVESNYAQKEWVSKNYSLKLFNGATEEDIVNELSKND